VSLRRESHMPRSLAFPLLAALLALPLLGCSGDPSRPASQITPKADQFQMDYYDIAPKEMVATIKRTLAAAPFEVPVEREEKGVLITGWKEYPGEMHIVRRWPERTRFRIIVIPDWDSPTTRCRLIATQETQARQPGSKWASDPEYDRPQRADEFLTQLRPYLKTPVAAGTK
jgi:hypothetical protein